MITTHCGNPKDHDQHVWYPASEDNKIDYMACPGGPNPDLPPGPQHEARPMRILDPEAAYDLQYRYEIAGFNHEEAWKLTLAAARGVARG